MNKQLSVFNYSVAQNKTDSDTLDIYIDGTIVDAQTQDIYQKYWGDTTSVSYKSFRDQVLASSAKKLNVWVNGPGGHVGDAMAIHDFLQDLQNKGYTVNTGVVGIAASAATYPALAAKNPTMSANSFLMIHNVSGFAWGYVNEIENYAATLRKFNNRIVQFYCDITGLTNEEISEMMNNETWLTAEEAKEKGFISSITGTAKFENQINKDDWGIRNTAMLNIYNSLINKNSEIMDLSKITEAISKGFENLSTKLGLTNSADQKPAFDEFTNTIVNAIKENTPAAITNEQVQDMVKNALEAQKEGDKQAMEDAVKAGTKNLVDADSLKNQLKTLEDNLTNSLSQAIGNKSEVAKDEKKKQGPKNRFSDVEWFDGE